MESLLSNLKQGGWKDRGKSISYYALLTSLLVPLFFAQISPSYANPEGGVVTAGSATISSEGTNTTINQSTDKAVIDWRSFNIESNEATRFNQPNSGSWTLNRVNSNAGASRIFGSLSANGNIMILNNAGILFGRGARVDVNGLIASTANISNSDFMSGNYHFQQAPGTSGYVINQGTITAKDGGLVALVAPGVENDGVINARVGKVSLASGNEYTVDLAGDQLINLAVGSDVTERPRDQNGNLMDSHVSNSGAIYADGGQVQLSARAAQGVVDNVINNKGVIEARSIGTRNGSISLGGGDHGIVKVSGQLNVSGAADGETGGTVRIAGEKIQLAAADINASGKRGGGKVYIGGEYQGKGQMQRAKSVYADKDTKIRANAIDSGDGGTVVVWSDETTQYYGKIEARGGANGGNGGLVETSGKNWLDVAGAQVSASAPKGQAGTWLLDPTNVTIVAAGSTTGGSFGSNMVWTPNVPNPGTSQILNTDIENALNGGTSVVITTNSTFVGTGNITQDASITMTSGIGANLTYNAANDININANITNTNPNGVLNVFLNGGNANQASQTNYNGAGGNVNIGSGVSIVTNGGNVNVVTAGDINVSGTINSNGQAGTNGGDSTDGTNGSTAGSIYLGALNGNINFTNASITAIGGAGGNGGNGATTAGNAGVAGNGNNITVTGNQLTITNSTISSTGGHGGAGGGITGGGTQGGNATDGGIGGNVSLTGTTVAISGSTVNSRGGTGGAGGSGANGTGGVAGAGGNSGSIAIAGTLGTTLSSSTTLTSAGATGGNGGSAGTLQGDPGAGGNGGAISVSDNRSLTISDTTITTSGGTAGNIVLGPILGTLGGNGGNAGAISLQAPTASISSTTFNALGGTATLDSFQTTGGDGGAGGAITITANLSGDLLNDTFNTTGGAGGGAASIGGDGGDAGAIRLISSVLGITNTSFTTAGGGAGTSPGVAGASSTWTANADTINLSSTSGAIGSISNAIFGSKSGGSAPTNFSFSQVSAITDSALPTLSQFQSGSINGMNYDITASGGNVTLSTASKYNGSALTLSSSGTTTLSTGLSLESLLINSPIITLLNVTTTGAQTYNASTSVSIGGNYTSSGGDILFNGPTLLNGTSVITSNNGAITFNNTLNVFNSSGLTLSAGTGDINFNGIVGGTLPLLGITISSADDVNINAAMTLRGNLSVTNSGNTTVAGNITTTGAAGSNGSSGGAGTAGGNITFNSTGNFTLTNATLNAMGGAGGNASTGAGGNGGNGGNISINAAAIALNTSNLLTGGGAGGLGGDSTTAGTGGNAGAGGNISLTGNNGTSLNQTILSTVSNAGGVGGDGTVGGGGGTGGTAGQITIADNTSFTASSTSSLRANGGNGGNTGTGPSVLAPGVGGNANTITVTAPTINVSNTSIQASGGLGGSAESQGVGATGGNGAQINFTATGTANYTSTTFASAGGNGGSGVIEPGGKGGNAALTTLTADTLTVTNPSFNTAGGTGGAGNPAGANGTASNWRLFADNLSLISTSGSIPVLNGIFGNEAGTAAPTNFTFRQLNAIADSDLPALAQFQGGSIVGMNYTIQSDNSIITIDTANKVDGTNLTLNATSGAVTVNPNLGSTAALRGLTINSPSIVTHNVITNGGNILINGALTLNSGVISYNSNGGDVTFEGTINSNSANTNGIDIQALTGDVTINGVVGGVNTVQRFTIQSAADVNINAEMNLGTTGLMVTNSGNTNVLATLSTTGIAGTAGTNGNSGGAGGNGGNAGTISFNTDGDFTLANGASILANGGDGGAGGNGTSGSGGNGGNGGNAAAVTIAANNITMGNGTVSSVGGTGGNGGTGTTNGGNAEDGGISVGITLTATQNLALNGTTVTANGGNGGNGGAGSTTGQGGNGRTGGTVALSANNATLTNAPVTVDGGLGGTGNPAGNNGADGTWSVQANTINLTKTTTGNIDVSNASFANQANTAAPTSFTYQQVSDISNANLPTLSQFRNINIDGMNYTVQSTGGDITITDMNAFTGSALTLNAADVVNLQTPITLADNLAALNVTAGSYIYLNNVTTNSNQSYTGAITGGGPITLNAGSGNIAFTNSGASPLGTIALNIANVNDLTVNGYLNVASYTQTTGNNTTFLGSGLISSGPVSITSNFINGRIVGGDTYLNGINGINANVDVSSLTLNGTQGGTLTGRVGGVGGESAALITRVVSSAENILLEFTMNGCFLGIGCSGPQTIFNDNGEKIVKARNAVLQDCSSDGAGNSNQLSPACTQISIDPLLSKEWNLSSL